MITKLLALKWSIITFGYTPKELLKRCHLASLDDSSSDVELHASICVIVESHVDQVSVISI